MELKHYVYGWRGDVGEWTNMKIAMDGSLLHTMPFHLHKQREMPLNLCTFITFLCGLVAHFLFTNYLFYTLLTFLTIFFLPFFFYFSILFFIILHWKFLEFFHPTSAASGEETCTCTCVCIYIWNWHTYNYNQKNLSNFCCLFSSNYYYLTVFCFKILSDRLFSIGIL